MSGSRTGLIPAPRCAPSRASRRRTPTPGAATSAGGATVAADLGRSVPARPFRVRPTLALPARPVVAGLPSSSAVGAALAVSEFCEVSATGGAEGVSRISGSAAVSAPAVSAPAGSGTADSGTAGSGTAGSGTAGSGTAGSGTAGSGAWDGVCGAFGAFGLASDMGRPGTSPASASPACCASTAGSVSRSASTPVASAALVPVVITSPATGAPRICQAIILLGPDKR